MSRRDLQAAQECFGRDLEYQLTEDLRFLLEVGKIEWREDPEIRGVVGLIVSGTEKEAVVIFYDGVDFEVDEFKIDKLMEEVCGE